MLGEIRLVASDGTELHGLLRQPKRLALLAYLAMPQPGTWHRRDTLLALFWPELDSARARTSLRNALYVLRLAVGDQVIRTRGDEELAIDAGAMVTDVGAVWCALREGRPEDALARYTGELLTGLHPVDSDGFLRWLDIERTRLRSAVGASAVARCGELEREGRVSEALALARRVLDIQRDDETLVRRVMSMHEAVGDRAGALALFESYRARLVVDFDAEPAAETAALALRFRTASPHPASVAAPVSPAKSPRTRQGSDRAAPSVDGVPEAPEAPEAPDLPGPVRVHSPRRTAAFAVGMGVAVATIGLMASSGGDPVEPSTIGRSTPLTVDEGLQVHASISPNGRLVAYARGNGNRLRIFIQKIGGGAAWPLTDDSLTFEQLPRWAPDDDELLFLARNNAYVAPAIGGSPTVVARGATGDDMVRSASWLPNGDSVAIVRHDSLIVQPLRGSGSRFVGSGKQLHSCVPSPDGKWFACVSGNWLAFEAGPLFGNEAPGALVLFPATGGHAIDLRGHDFQHKSPAWSADGTFLWFLSNRDGPSGEVYAVRIGRDGRASGATVRVGLTAESISLSEGRIAYSVPVRRGNIWSLPLPGRTVLTLSDAMPITTGTQLIEVVHASDDGQWLVYDSNLPGNADQFRLSLATGKTERLTDDPRPEYTGALSPDGRELAWQRFVNGERHLFVKRIDEDDATEIMPVPGDQGVPRWAPDGRSLAAWSHHDEEGTVFVVQRDVHGRWGAPAWRLRGGQLPVWSPDGRTIAFVRYDGRIQTIPADSGAVRTIHAPRRGTGDPVATFLLWRFDADTILFLGSNAHGHAGVWSVPARGGDVRLRADLRAGLGRGHGPSLTADRRRLYFTLDERFSNVRWAELVRR